MEQEKEVPFFRENGATTAQEQGMLAEEQSKKIPMFKSWVGLSSQVVSTSYNEKDQYMIAEFNNGSRYKYAGVSLEVWKQLLNTTSIGKFLNATIKPNYTCTKL
jgi:hypothetical protein